MHPEASGIGTESEGLPQAMHGINLLTKFTIEMRMQCSTRRAWNAGHTLAVEIIAESEEAASRCGAFVGLTRVVPLHSDFDRSAIGSERGVSGELQTLETSECIPRFVILGQARSEATRRRP
ncbi:hypothetical protein [Mesorhizobium sp.]|uniref:hypothetical protein n=1 Tax=Mesorhizobium sp. TaxID=1871066 RepID=UPI00257D73D0|nr:hypothetical protein [Mesorhizobium sp.]